MAFIDTLPASIVAIKINTPLVFTSSGSYDPDTNQFISGYKWLKDGVNQNSNTPNFETSFDSVGNHTITLSVFDNFLLEETDGTDVIADTNVLVQGDFIVADLMGVVVVPLESAEEVVRLAQEQADREVATRAWVAKGKTVEDLLNEFGRI